MDPVGLLSEVGAGQPAQVAAGVGGGAAVPRDVDVMQAVQMVPSGRGSQTGGVPFGDKVWSSIDNLSVQFQEVRDSLKTSLAEPPKAPEYTGDMVADMRTSMVEMQNQQNKLMNMQMRLGETGAVFSVGIGMIQSAQHSARTLLQDK